MKNTFNFIISFVAFAITALVTGSAVSAQNLADGTYMEQNGIAFAKRSTLNPDGTYTVDLETFVTGEVTQTYEAVPVDVVLVLDLSGSMDDKISSVSYEPASVSTISGNQGPTSYGSVNYPWETVFYYKYESGYYLVSVGRQRGSGWNYNTYYYYLSFQAGGRTYYINTSGDVVTSRPDNVTSASTNLLNSSVQLYSRVVTTSDKTKMEALQTAVKAFIDQIAHNAGGSGNTSVSGGSSLTVDIVSSSFSVPTNSQSASDVVEVLVAPCNGVTEIDGVEYLTFGAEDTPQNCGLPAITPSISVADNKVSTTGFDYSANWCGPDPTSATRYHGYKQIIRFVITLKDDAVGGPAVETNEPGSGIYLPNSTEPLITFNRPTVKIPVQIWIQKAGLQGNDTAVFNLRRTPFADFDPDHPEDAVWEDDWGTKIVIGPDDLDPVTGYCIKKQVGLDPDYYYMIKEDAWAFGYTYQLGGKQYTYGDNAHNPFTFTNIPNNKKFDEAQVRNVFYAKPQPTTPPSTGTDSK